MSNTKIEGQQVVEDLSTAQAMPGRERDPSAALTNTSFENVPNAARSKRENSRDLENPSPNFRPLVAQGLEAAPEAILSKQNKSQAKIISRGPKAEIGTKNNAEAKEKVISGRRGILRNPHFKYRGGIIARLLTFLANVIKSIEEMVLSAMRGTSQAEGRRDQRKPLTSLSQDLAAEKKKADEAREQKKEQGQSAAQAQR